MDERSNTHEKSKMIKNNYENFQLFTSNKDKYTTNIFEISDPFEFMIPQYIERVEESDSKKYFTTEGLSLFSSASNAANLRNLFSIEKQGVVYELDFNSLSDEIKEKLEAGIFKIGDSKTVEGNKRATIVDATKANQRVKDVTLKEKQINKDISPQLTNLAIQAQLQQIYEKVSTIQVSQEYQLKWDRNDSIRGPFEVARTKLIEFHISDDIVRKKHLLQDALNNLDKSVASIKTDLESNKVEIESELKNTMYKYENFKRHADFILEDINLLLKMVGMQMYIDLTLGNEKMAQERMKSVSHIFELYSNRQFVKNENNKFNALEHIPYINKYLKKNEVVELPSLLEVIHNNYKYQSFNNDLWLNINDEMQESSKLSLLSDGGVNDENN